jgi:hypothetical protein
MKNTLFVRVCIVLSVCLAAQSAGAQQSASATMPVGGVPRLISYSGTLKDSAGRIVTGSAGVTFLIYKDETGSAPLWLETQSVKPDASGRYSVQIGAASANGLPAEIFTSGEARWLAVQLANEPEQPRVLLVAVPYAMKAADAETLGGLPPSAFVLADRPTPGGATTSNDANAVVVAPSGLPPASTVTTTGGTVNAIPLFTAGTNIQNSILTQSTTSAINVGGKLNLLATGTATASGGKNSQPEVMVASVFNSGTSTAVPQKFEWQAEPSNNDKTTASGTLNLLYGSGTAAPAETGLKINNKGQITFASGQSFPGAGSITGVTAGTDLKGGGTSGTVTLNLDTTKVPQLNAANTFTTNQTVNGNVAASGAVTGASSTFDGSTIGVSSTGSQYGGIFATYTGGTGLYAFNKTDCNYCTGVEGYAFGSSSSENINVGVFGSTNAPRGVGVYGQYGDRSGNGAAGQMAGVWGDASNSAGESASGVLGTADDAVAILGLNRSHSPDVATIVAISDDPDGYSFLAAGANSDGGYCHIDAAGNLGCTGVVAGVVGVDGNSRRVKLYPVEAPQNWFEDAGSGKLSEGQATVNLEPIFGQTVNTGIEYHVFLTPAGDCEGLYVSNKTPKSFEVHELRGGHSSVAFDYRIMATRKGYEGVRLAEERHPPDPTAQLRALLKGRVKPALSEANRSVQTPSTK